MVITVRPTTSVRKSLRKNLPPRNTPDSFCRRFTRQNFSPVLQGGIFLLRELHLENFMSRPDVIPTFRQRRCKTGAETSFGANGDQHTRAAELSTYFCVLTIRKQLPGNGFERSGRGQEPSRGHKFSILENLVLHRDFTSTMRLHFRSDLVGACLPQTLLRTDEEELCQFDTIPPTIERNRALPMGERPVSLVICGFFKVRSQGAPCFCFEPSPAF